jgi:hypothetical protein
LGRGREPAQQQVEDEGAHLTIGERLVVDCRGDEPSDDSVVGGAIGQPGPHIPDEGVDVRRVLGESAPHALPPVGAVHGRPLALHHLGAPHGNAGGVLHREAEQVHRGVVGQRPGERGHEVDRAGDEQGIEQATRRRADELLLGPDRRRVEGGHHHPPHTRMLRRIHLAEHPVLGGHRDARGAEAFGVREVHRVPQHVAGNGVASHVVHALTDGHDRVGVSPQLLQAREDALGVVGFEGVVGLGHP